MGRSSIVVSAIVLLISYRGRSVLRVLAMMRHMACVGCTLIAVRVGRSRVALMHRSSRDEYFLKTVIWVRAKFWPRSNGKDSCPLIRWNRLLANLAIKWSSGTRIRELDRNHFLIFGPNLSDGMARYPRRPITLNLAIIALRTNSLRSFLSQLTSKVVALVIVWKIIHRNPFLM